MKLKGLFHEALLKESALRSKSYKSGRNYSHYLEQFNITYEEILENFKQVFTEFNFDQTIPGAKSSS